MPLDVLDIVASQVILRNVANPPSPQDTARLSIASGLVPGPVGLVLPIVASRAQSGGGGGGALAGRAHQSDDGGGEHGRDCREGGGAAQAGRRCGDGVLHTETRRCGHMWARDARAW